MGERLHTKGKPWAASRKLSPWVTQQSQAGNKINPNPSREKERNSVTNELIRKNPVLLITKMTFHPLQIKH